MSWRAIVGLTSAAVAAVASACCGAGSNATDGGPATNDAAGKDGGRDATEAGDGAAPRVGLDRRPPNSSCHAPAAPVPAGLAGLPPTLSASGCFEAADPTRPLPALIPYAINVPFWSDGAEKARWLVLPDGASIAIAADGDLHLPPGALLIKTFRRETRRIETRFYVRHADGAWSGYTYAWNEAGTDAVLLDEGSQRRMVGNSEWHFPSRAECDACHTEGAGRSLGLELAQLDREFDYDGGRRAGQLETWAHIGLFAGPLPAPGARPTPLPALTDPAAPLDTRARAYLHANCANCHRPTVGNSGTSDLRFTTPLAQTMICDAPPVKGTLGYGTDVRLIAPGTPDKSMVLLRMRALDSTRMPSAASLLVDDAGVLLLTSWITARTGCDAP
jgi:uncharacterized repeat protein (TIGR03806 family)